METVHDLDLDEALKLFSLIVIVKSPAPTTGHKLTEFFNYRCDIFESLTVILNQLELEGFIQKKANSFVLEGTAKAVDLVNSAPIDLVLERLQPDGAKRSFYDAYTAHLK